MYKFYLFFSVKAVSTNFAWFESDGSHHIVETMIPQRSKVQLFADLVEHQLAQLGKGLALQGHTASDELRILVHRVETGKDAQRLHLLVHSACDQIHFGVGTGEVQVFTSVL